MENGVLQIVNVSHSDRGVYTCVARTPVDGDEASAALLVLGEPETSEGADLTLRDICGLYISQGNRSRV